MFAKATSKFVSEIDPDGCLIPVSRLNESDNLTILSLVIKRKRFWFWQRAKYLPTDFTLNHILKGEETLHPGIIETDFLKYKSTSENNLSGSAEAGFGPGNVNLEGKGSSKLATSFGNLKKQEVDVQRLLHDSKERVLDLMHSLVQQTVVSRREVFALVKERIVTTQTCTITEEVQEEGSCAAFLGFTVPKKIQVSVKNGSRHSDSNVSLEIPANTALAYCLIELSVKSNGHFEFCLLPNTAGGFEVDGITRAHAPLLQSTPSETLQLQQEWEKLGAQFKVLSVLPVSKKSSLFQKFTLLLENKPAIAMLNFALEDLCCGIEPDISTLDKTPTLKEILVLLKEEGGGDYAPVENITLAELQPSVLTATQLLTSALDEMTDPTLSALGPCCSPSTLQALHLLAQNTMENKPSSLKDSMLTVLAAEDTYSKVQHLFASCNVTLHKEGDSIDVQISSQQGHLFLILCIAITSLASLASCSAQV